MLRKNLKFKLYMVKDSTEVEKELFLTIVKNKEQATNYINSLVKLKHTTHFKMWCELRKQSPDDVAWSQYAKIVLTPRDYNKYIIVPKTYSLDNLISILRMFSGCIPLGCKHESNGEIMYEFMQLPKKLQDKLLGDSNKNKGK